MAAAALPVFAQNKPEDFPKQPDVPPLSPEEQLKKFQLPPGYKLELVLAEPHIKEPVVAVFDGNGLELREHYATKTTGLVLSTPCLSR